MVVTCNENTLGEVIDMNLMRVMGAREAMRTMEVEDGMVEGGSGEGYEERREEMQRQVRPTLAEDNEDDKRPWSNHRRCRNKAWGFVRWWDDCGGFTPVTPRKRLPSRSSDLKNPANVDPAERINFSPARWIQFRCEFLQAMERHGTMRNGSSPDFHHRFDCSSSALSTAAFLISCSLGLALVLNMFIG